MVHDSDRSVHLTNALKRFPARTFLLLRRGAASLVATAGSRDAAQVAYYLVMSFPAALLLLVWCFSALLGDNSVRDSIVDSIVDALPLADREDQQQVERMLDDIAEGAGTLGWISAFALLYSASGAIGALRYAVNEAWGERDTRPYVPGKALDAGLTLVAAPALLVALGLTLSGALAASIGDRPWIVAVAQLTVTKLVPIAVLLALLVGLFFVLPAKRARLKAACFGGLAALAGILLVQLGTEAYFAAFGDTGAVYGTLGVLIAVAFAAYLDALAIVYGAHVAAQASRLPSAAAIDRELEKGAGEPIGRFVIGILRGLFVRGRPRR